MIELMRHIAAAATKAFIKSVIQNCSMFLRILKDMNHISDFNVNHYLFNSRFCPLSTIDFLLKLTLKCQATHPETQRFKNINYT